MIKIMVLFILMASAQCYAQDQLREHIRVHLDRTYYLAGEEISFAVYCNEIATGEPSRISNVVYVDLVNPDGMLLVQEKINLKDGAGSGTIHIPPDVSSSEHVMRAYTSWMKNFSPASFCYNTILIIHPLKKYTAPEILETDTGEPDPRSQNMRDPGMKPALDIRGLKQIYRSRDTIEFDLLATPAAGVSRPLNLSVSITRSGSLDTRLFFASPALPDSVISIPDWEHIKRLPDMEGLRVSGTLLKRGNGEPVVNTSVLLSFIDSTTEIYCEKTNARGRFHFELHDLHGSKDMMIQVPGETEPVMVTLDPDQSTERIPDWAWISLYRDSLIDLYGDLILEQQLSAAYHLSPDAIAGRETGGTPVKKPLAFYGLPDHRIIMENYISLPVMEEVFRELGKRIFLSRESGTYKVRILDLETNRIIGDQPYFFLDGVPFFDSDQLLALDPSQILSISLLSRRYFMGDLVMDGIIDIRSVRGDASMIEFPRSAIRQYFQGFPEKTLNRRLQVPEADPRIPYYKTTLLFEPRVQVWNNKPATMMIIAPDSKGRYIIAVRGVTQHGIPVQQNYSFEVR